MHKHCGRFSPRPSSPVAVRADWRLLPPPVQPQPQPQPPQPQPPTGKSCALAPSICPRRNSWA